MDSFVQAARQAVSQAGWNPRFDLEILDPRQPRDGRLGYRAGTVKLVHDAELMPRLQSRLEACGLDADPQEAFEEVVAARVFMQVGSFRVCPFSSYDYADMLYGASDGLRSVGANEAEVKDFTISLTSYFIASVIGGVYALEGPDPQRFRRGFLLDQLSSYSPNERPMPVCSAIYAEVQQRIWGDDERLGDAVQAGYPSPLETLPFEADRGVAILLDSYEHVGRTTPGLAWDDPALLDLVVEELKYWWKKWPLKCFQFAELLGPYLISNPHERCRGPQLFLRQPGQPSHDAQQRWEAARLAAGALDPRLQAQREDFQLSALPGAPFDPFADRLAYDRWFRRDIIEHGIGRRRTPLSPLLGFDTLDAVYRRRAVDVTIEAESRTRPGCGLDVAHMSRVPCLETLPPSGSIDFGASRFDGHGDLVLMQRQLPITDSSPAVSNVTGFPDLMLIVDSSGSMRWDAASGAGAYDSLLRAVYSVLAFLERRRKAQHMRFAVVNFSGQTVKSRWHSYAELTTVKKLLFKHQGGGTTLHAQVVKQLAEASPDRFLCLMISDGKISNHSEVYSVVRQMTAVGHGFAMIQIGVETPLVTQLRAGGLPAHVIRDHRELEGLCLEYGKRNW